MCISSGTNGLDAYGVLFEETPMGNKLVAVRLVQTSHGSKLGRFVQPTSLVLMVKTLCVHFGTSVGRAYPIGEKRRDDLPGIFPSDERHVSTLSVQY